MKLLIAIAMCAMSIIPAQATTLECTVSTTESKDSPRMTPFVAINYRGTVIKLGQDLFPDFQGCLFFCLGEKVYVYQDDALLGIIDKDYAFHCADRVVVNWILPRPEKQYAASKDEVDYICSRVFCAQDKW